MSKADASGSAPTLGSVHGGGCLCGAIRYEIEGDLAPIQICHCEDCRKAQGSAFAANVPVATARFRVTAGETRLRAYQSSPGKERLFCSVCGSPLLSRLSDRPDMVRIRAGTLDGGAPVHVGFHFFTASRAGWWPILDALPRYAGPRPAA
jgi:hypothetical protein